MSGVVSNKRHYRAFPGGGCCGRMGMRLQLVSLNSSLELICHICFVPCRSLNMDFENQDKEKDNSSTAGSFNGNSTNNSKGQLYSLPSLLFLSASPAFSAVCVCLSCCIADSPDPRCVWAFPTSLCSHSAVHVWLMPMEAEFKTST